MPEAESMFGKFLNRLLGPDEEGVQREQEIDGRELPKFEEVSKYLGPTGLFARSQADGWFLSGFLLTKENPTSGTRSRTIGTRFESGKRHPSLRRSVVQ